MTEPNITETVRNKYAAVAASGLTNDSTGVRAVAEAFGYSPDDLAALPAGANMGLSCGNPTATANLRPGEVVVDLGCGGGIDVFLAARKVGPTGKAIGIDMTPEMIDRARRNAAQLAAAGEPVNAEFHLARMEQMPLADGTVDCLISNCVINLAADKAAVFREMFRVLKPGGRVAVSDIALKRELPAVLAKSVTAYVGCVAGALVVAEYERLLKEAGFAAVQIVDTKKDLNAYAQVDGPGGCCSAEGSDTGVSCCGTPQVSEEEWIASSQSCCGVTPAATAGVAEMLDVNTYAASVRVYAIKP